MVKFINMIAGLSAVCVAFAEDWSQDNTSTRDAEKIIMKLLPDAELRMDRPFLELCLERIQNTGRVPPALIDTLNSWGVARKKNKVNCLSGKECNVPMVLSGIYHYGCWCNFGKDLMEGRGPVQNAHDEICQRMQFCLRCAKRDGEDEDAACSPPSQTYVAKFNINKSKNKLATACGKANGNDNCAARVCTCELGMIGDLVALIWTGYTYDPAQKHPKIGGTFDFEGNCPALDANDPPSGIECCGKYPARYPYSVGSAKACCNGNIYSELSQQCCDSGVKDVGSAC